MNPDTATPGQASAPPHPRNAKPQKSRARRRSTTSIFSLFEAAQQTLQGVSERYQIRENIHAHPLKSAGLALGAGYVLGGGLLTPLTGRILLTATKLGIRLAALPFIRDEIYALMERASPE